MGDVDANDVSAALADNSTEVTDGGGSGDPAANHSKTFTVVVILMITLVVCVGFYFLLQYLARPVKASERQKT